MKTQEISARKIGEDIKGGSIGLVGLLGSINNFPIDCVRVQFRWVRGKGLCLRGTNYNWKKIVCDYYCVAFSSPQRIADSTTTHFYSFPLFTIIPFPSCACLVLLLLARHHRKSFIDFDIVCC